MGFPHRLHGLFHSPRHPFHAQMTVATTRQKKRIGPFVSPCSVFIFSPGFVRAGWLVKCGGPFTRSDLDSDRLAKHFRTTGQAFGCPAKVVETAGRASTPRLERVERAGLEPASSEPCAFRGIVPSQQGCDLPTELPLKSFGGFPVCRKCLWTDFHPSGVPYRLRVPKY